MPERRRTPVGRPPARILCAALLLPLALGVVIEAAEPQVASYTARYEVEFRGRVAGMAEFAVSHDERRGIYTFSSRTRARGLLRLARPNEVVERSDFVVENGQIRPLEFRYEDGSRKGEDDFHLVFDWAQGFVAVNRGGESFQLELTPGVLDRGAMQVALMRDIEATGRPGPYTVANDDELASYEYVRQDDGKIETASGTFRAQSFLQQRAGSSRTTLVWVVPELRYLPAVIEQYRDGELRTRMSLEWVEGLEPDGG